MPAHDEGGLEHSPSTQLRQPVPRDRVASREPDAGLRRRMRQEALEPPDPPGPADDAQVQAHRHHPWRRAAFCVEPVEGVDAVAGEIVPEDEAAAALEAHVVGVEGIRQHQMLSALDIDQKGKVVIVGVGIIEEAAMLAQQPAGVERGRRARVPADRRRAGGLRDCRHGARDRLALLPLVHMGVPLPAPAMGGDLVPVGHRLLHQPGRERDGAAIGIQRRRHAILLQQRADARPAGARAIFEMRFHAEIAHAGDLFDHLVDALVALVALADRELRALLDIDDDGDGEPRVVRPADCGWIAAIAAEIAVAHGSRHQRSAIRRRPTSRSPMTSTAAASRISRAEIAAIVGSGLSSTYCSIWMGKVLVQASVKKIEIG